MTGESALDPPGARDLVQQALVAARAGQHDEGIRLLKEAVSREPTHTTAHNELGVLYYHRGDYERARDCFRQAVNLDPEFTRALTNLGACHNDLENHAEAIACYRTALAQDPTLVDTWGNLGKAWNDLEEFEMAVASYRQGLELEQRPELMRGLAKAYRKSGRYQRAEQLLREAISLDPQDADAHFGRSLALFHLERYPEALQEFEWRMNVREMIRHRRELHPIFDRPVWNGQDLTDKTLLIHSEQGFGDVLQFARFIPLLGGRGQRLVAWCRPGLGELLQHCFDIDSLSEDVFQLPPFDYQLPILSIARYFDPRLSMLDNPRPYLSAPPGQSPVQEPAHRPRVGLVWGASDSGFDHRNKKIPLTALRPLLAMEGIDWYSLQVGSDREDMAALPADIRPVDLGPQLRNFADTARAVDKLDLVISVDTAVAHLSGALGKPVWVLLKMNPDWRWHNDGEHSAWYPSARLYRQASHGDWGILVQRVLRDLGEWRRGAAGNPGATMRSPIFP